MGPQERDVVHIFAEAHDSNPTIIISVSLATVVTIALTSDNQTTVDQLTKASSMGHKEKKCLMPF